MARTRETRLPKTPGFMITFDQTTDGISCYFHLGYSPMRMSVEVPALASLT